MLIRTLDDTIAALTVFEDRVAIDAAELNNVFAWRVLNYALDGMNATIAIDLEKVNANILGTRRTQGDVFEIVSRRPVATDMAEQLSSIVQERVMFLLPAPGMFTLKANPRPLDNVAQGAPT